MRVGQPALNAIRIHRGIQLKMDRESTTDLFYNYEHRVIYKIRKTGFPIAIVSCIVLLVVCIVLAVLYSRAVTLSPTSPSGQKPKKYEICDDERCFHLALELAKKMNKSVDPCQDFYAYACGGWEKRTPFGSASPVTTKTFVDEENTKVIKNALEQAHLNYSQNAAVMKTVRFYNSCINTTAIDSYGSQPLKDLIKEYGGWSVSSNYDPNVTLQTRIGKFARELNVNALFSVHVGIDPYDSGERILQLIVAPLARHELGFGRQSLNSKLNDIKIESAYLKYMKAVGRMLSGSNSSDAKMESIYKLEKILIKLFGHQDRSVEFENYIHYILKNADKDDPTMSLSSFCNESGFPLPFMQEILSSIFGVHFKGTEKILAGPMESFKKLYKLYQNVKPSLLADYFMWQAVIKYIHGLGDNYINPNQEMYQFLTGTLLLPRWTLCIKTMMTPFDLTLGLLYVDANFKDNSKKMVEVMVENVRSSFIQNLQDQSWMDEKTRDLVKQKALAITASIGYPSSIKDQSKLDAHYKSLIATDNFFGNLKALNYFFETINVNRYGKPVDKHEWRFGSPSKWNGYYYSKLNKIVLLAGIIQPPMYTPGFPRYMNYGGIGTVIGHEITHGFDGTGRLYNKYGNRQQWWPDSADKSFMQKAQCFVKQYSNYKVFGRHINGSQTLDENIADNGGIKIAYDAYQLWAKTNGTEKVLPGLERNPDQLFFLGFAQTYCSKYSKADAIYQLETDKHSFQKYRVIGSLSNFKKFSEAFNCPANSPMNPTTKCRIW